MPSYFTINEEFFLFFPSNTAHCKQVLEAVEWQETQEVDR